MIKDLINSTTANTKERINNPFIASFFISAFILNWRVFLVLLFADLGIIQRIEFVSEKYISFWDYLIFPLILALLYVLALPYLMDLISTMVRKAKTNKIKNFYDEEVLKTQEKTKLARHQVLLEREKADSKELTDLNDRIQQLEKSNNEKDNLIKQVRKEYKDLETEYLDLSKNSINNVSKEREVIEDTLMSNEKLLNKLAMVASAWKSPTPFSVKFEMIEKDDQFHYLAKNKVIRYVPYNNEKEGKLELTELGILIWENLYKYHTSKIDNIDNIIQNQINLILQEASDKGREIGNMDLKSELHKNLKILGYDTSSNQFVRDSINNHIANIFPNKDFTVKPARRR